MQIPDDFFEFFQAFFPRKAGGGRCARCSGGGDKSHGLAGGGHDGARDKKQERKHAFIAQARGFFH